MAKCRFCDHQNPPGTERCQSCSGPMARDPGVVPDEAPDNPSLGSGSAFEQRLLDLLSSGRKIEAIKMYREQTGAGLKQAKDAVEALGQQHGISSRGTGCLGVLLTVALLAVTALVLR